MLAKTVKDLHAHYTDVPKTEKLVMSESQHLRFKIIGYMNLAVHKILLLLLYGHSIFGLYEGMKFMVYDYPQIEEKFSIHLLSAQELNEAVVAAIIAMISTSFMIVLAVRLSVVRERVAHLIDIATGTILIIGHNFFQTYLLELDLIDITRFLQ